MTPEEELLSELPIPANFFWDISVRFLSWECWDFSRRHDHFRRFPKKSEVFQRSPKSSEDVWSLRTRIKASSLPVLFTSKIRDREEGIVIYSFYTWFSFLTWVWVYIFLEIVSSKTATTHIFQSGVRNWPTSVDLAWDRSFQPAGMRLTPKAWELAGITSPSTQRPRAVYPTSHGNFGKIEKQLPQKSVGWQMANSLLKNGQQFLRFNQLPRLSGRWVPGIPRGCHCGQPAPR